MESAEFYHAKALLEWQVELGATDAICDAPIDRYAVPDVAAKKTQSPEVVTSPRAKAPEEAVDAVAQAQLAAASAADLSQLRAALDGFEHCALKNGARNLVFSDGAPEAQVMIVGEAPGRDEDKEGRPFVGRAGQLLDRMLGAIDMGRDHPQDPVYITNVLPWRPPQNRDPNPAEIAMLKPFLERHIALVQPRVLVIMGNISAQALLGKRGITRLRGHWTESQSIPALPMFHPAYLLRNPAAKRDAWADLLSLKAKVRDG